jgi:hypothetical protein
MATINDPNDLLTGGIQPSTNGTTEASTSKSIRNVNDCELHGVNVVSDAYRLHSIRADTDDIC